MYKLHSVLNHSVLNHYTIIILNHYNPIVQNPGCPCIWKGLCHKGGHLVFIFCDVSPHLTCLDYWQMMK